ncbi:SDR family NAD(P)-dependent oxidoreductase [Vulgatibacter sp.]|uniref:SDR family NAD(P)-dependent oxidoreductase n=1 Tax=Vulgatibacter sp. TaxID=1971226 RepID=UPI003564FFC7
MSKAFVTGAGIRVGRATALALAHAGYDLVLHAHASVDALEEVAAQARALGRQVDLRTADLSDPDAVDRLAAALRAEHPALDLVVHNAGIFERVPFARIDRARYRRMQAINLEAPFFLTQGLLPSLLAAPAPCVIHVTDIAAERPYDEYAHYSVSKAGLLMLTRALAVELGPKVRVNGVAPGTVAFPPDYDEATKQSILARVPMGREGDPEDVARAVLFLAQQPYVTGQVINVDGGRSVVL